MPVNYKSIFTSLTLVTLCVIALLATLLLWPRRSNVDDTGKIDRQRFPESEALRQSWTLAPGAQVKVKDIAGPVTIETHDDNTAEVYAERAATRRAVFSELPLKATYRAATADLPETLSLDNTAWQKQTTRSGLRRLLGLERAPEFRERVVVKLPRRVNLLISKIHGNLDIGALDGIVRILDVEGNVQLAKATEARQLGGIEGALEATLVRLGKELHVGDVNGPVKLHFLEEPNTHIRGTFVLGTVNAQLPGFRVTEKRFLRFQGENGTGASLITFFNIHDAVTLDYVSKPQLAKTPASR